MNYIKNTGIMTVHYKSKICSFNIQDLGKFIKKE